MLDRNILLIKSLIKSYETAWQEHPLLVKSYNDTTGSTNIWRAQSQLWRDNANTGILKIIGFTSPVEFFIYLSKYCKIPFIEGILLGTASGYWKAHTNYSHGVMLKYMLDPSKHLGKYWKDVISFWDSLYPYLDNKGFRQKHDAALDFSQVLLMPSVQAGVEEIVREPSICPALPSALPYVLEYISNSYWSVSADIKSNILRRTYKLLLDGS